VNFDLWPAWLCPRVAPIAGARLVVGIVTQGDGTAAYTPRPKRPPSRERRVVERQRQRQKRALLVARGLTSKGKPRIRA
jgi:hypothetical protein